MSIDNHRDSAAVHQMVEAKNQVIDNFHLSVLPTSVGNDLIDSESRREKYAYPGKAFPSVSFRLRSSLTSFTTPNAPYLALYRHLRQPYSKLLLGFAILLSIAAGVPLPLIGVLFGKIINSFPPPEDEIRSRIGQLLAVALAYFVITWGWAVCWGIVGERIGQELRQSVVKTVLGMDQTYFDVHSPDLANVLTEHVQTVQLGTSEKVGLFLQAVSYFFAAFTVGFILNAKLTGILFVAVIPSMVIVVLLGNRSTSKLARRCTAIGHTASSDAQNAVQSVQIVQAYDAANPLLARHLGQITQKTYFAIRKAMVSALVLGLVFFIAYSANALAFFEGYRQQRDNQSDSNAAGTIYAVVFLILDASFVVGQFGPFIQIFSAAADSGEELHSIIDYPRPKIDVYSDAGKAVLSQTLKADIVLRDVTFSYPHRSSTKALDCVNLRISAGRITGIVGASGSGKSTIALLLLRLYDPCDGQILVDSQDIRNCNISDLRRKIAYVSQDPVLFPGTILENIKYGLSASGLSGAEALPQCLEAAEEARCDFLSSLPDGINTQVGSSGFARLSGGQKQRICLARALVRNPDLLILDEYTSALDSCSERAVIESLKQASTRKRRTVVVIGHRLATIKSADCIFVMGDGAVLEHGSHDMLYSGSGSYKQLVDAQEVGLSASSGDGNRDRLNKKQENLSTSSKSGDAGNVHFDNAEVALTPETNRAPSTLQVLRRCWSTSKEERGFVLVGLAASVLSGCVMIGEAVIFGHLVDLLKHQSNDEMQHFSPDMFCLLFFILAIVALLAYSASGSSFGVCSERLVARLQDQSLRSLLRQDMAWFLKSRHTPAELMAVMHQDVGHLKSLSGSILGILLSAFVSVVGGILLAHIIAWKIAIVLLPAVPVMLVAGFLRVKVLTLAEQRQRQAYISATALASEACKQSNTVAAYGLEQEFSLRFNSIIRTRCREGLRFMLSSNLFLAFSLAITYFVYALAYWWGAKQVRDHQYTTLQFFIVLPALLFSAQSAGQMFSFAPEITRAKTAARSVFGLLDERPSILSEDDKAASTKQESHLPGDEPPNTARKGSLEFRAVKFCYPTRQNVLALNKVDFSIRAGEFIGIVGQSGAGKSSIMALIQRFYDPLDGTILVDGENIRGLSVQRYRARLGYVAQDSDLFAGSIAFNIALGAKQGQRPSRVEIVELCQRCSVHEFISSLPEGYDTECGPNGSRLSGGQRQRIAIARAMIRDPDILLLDEPTSQLDALVERDIREAISAAARDKTVIMVTHKLANVQNADRIFVFDAGQVVETGTHAELITSGGAYARLAETQSLG